MSDRAWTPSSSLRYGLESLDILQMVHPITLGTRIRVSHLHTGEQARYDSLDMVSMVCHEKLGASVLVADRFQVWELSAANDWVPQHSPSVDQCLDKDAYPNYPGEVSSTSAVAKPRAISLNIWLASSNVKRELR
eukprot:5814813-Amphidinium_carterae.1